MKKAYIFLAEGFEEIEALAPADIMRRAGIEVCLVGLSGDFVTGGHKIAVKADINAAEGFALPQDASLIMLPGGWPGYDNLGKSEVMRAVLKEAAQRGNVVISAICGAPTVLYNAGLLNGKTVTVFPGMEKEMPNANVTTAAVEEDGSVITGRSAGVAVQFAHALTARLAGKEKADEVVGKIYP